VAAEPTPIDWGRVRGLFPAAAGDVVYLDTGAYGPGPTPVREAVEEALAAWSNGTGAWREWEQRAEDARGLFARLIGAAPGNVALLHALSAAASQVAESLPAPEVPGGANLVVGAEEFRSNLFPWMNQERRGFELRLVPFRDGRIPAEDMAAAVDERTALVAASHVQSSNGYRIDLEALVSACRAVGARLFVDATQSAGALRIPLDGIDYLAAGAYKWLLSPRGSAFLYAAPDRLAELRPLQPSWKTPTDPHESYYGPPYEPAESASRLDGSLAWPVWVGTARALELVLELGIEAIERRDLELSRRFRAGLPGIGLRPLFGEDESSQIVGLRVPDPAAVKRSLADAKIVAAVRGTYLRTSFHFFNDERDVDRALEALGSAQAAG